MTFGSDVKTAGSRHLRSARARLLACALAAGIASSDSVGAVLGRSTMTGDYTAVTRVAVSGMPAGAAAGLSAYGNPENAIGVAVRDGRAFVWRRVKGAGPLRLRASRAGSVDPL